MRRREFLKSAAGTAAVSLPAGGAATAAAADALGGTPARAGGPAELAAPTLPRGVRELVLVLPATCDGMAIGGHAFRLARRIEAATDGCWRIAVARTDGTGPETVAAAEADFWLADEHRHARLHPAFHAFAGLPLGVQLGGREHRAWLSVGGGQELWDELAAGFGMKSLAVWHSGSGGPIISNVALEQVGDLDGLRIASRGLACEVLERLGARPLASGDARAMAALARRQLDAVEPLDGGAGEAGARWVYGGGPNAGGTGLALGMRLSFWQRLGNDGRAMLEAVAGEALQLSLDEALAQAAMGRQARAMTRKAPPRTLPSEIAEAVISTSKGIIDGLGAADPVARRIFDSHRGFRELLAGGDTPPVG